MPVLAGTRISPASIIRWRALGRSILGIVPDRGRIFSFRQGPAPVAANDTLASSLR